MRIADLLKNPPVDPLEARMLLSHATGLTRTELVTQSDLMLESARLERYRTLLQRRIDGEPMAYIIGEREFYGRPFRVTPDVLIPRPETELLVELALERIDARLKARSAAHSNARSGTHSAAHNAAMTNTASNAPIAGPAPRVLDLGTGSGAIGVTLACERPAATVTLVDLSPTALAIAVANARQLGATVHALAADWFSALSHERFDVIVANPPYIAQGDAHLVQGDLRFEPLAALASGPDGLDALRAIVAGAPEYLAPGGWLLLEHGHDQATAVRHLLQQAGFAGIRSWRDLAGIERISGGVHGSVD